MKSQINFKEKQKTYSRVRDAYAVKFESLRDDFSKKNISFPPKEIYIRSFKSEQELELWVKEEDNYVLFKTYKVCKGSGTLGPKIKQGDGQVPEGLYHIDRFNPASAFWLSLGINYPNEADLIRSGINNPGGDIFIHGNCVTIGCLPMTDDFMKEIYVLAVEAKSSGQNKIPVHIFPYRFSLLNNTIYKSFRKEKLLWSTLESEFDYFNANKKIRSFVIDYEGNYIF